MKPIQKKTVKRTPAFREWFDGLEDQIAKTAIAARIERVELGLVGDVKPIGEGVWEIRIDHGPGYRVYYTEVGNVIVLLLSGGDKSTQKKGAKAAKNMLGDMVKEQKAKKAEAEKAAKSAPKAPPKPKR